ncbi:hypothetical protein N7509_000091 [Penicillium cosmopolitanum]|uniref:Uncharacterized protein n=1 Tax=Penicillium cosmopolitanum TaxID=1131564 RepID=A0A9X0BFC9_9EURO|nr:uncharacterized protein N7509_000091 [Penicillium cosmopolitanum]KAJ5414993.1 hypothetical protein N7509_000091 [Penicillium cosmopolitanum]
MCSQEVAFSDNFPLNPATHQICRCPLSQRGSESNPIDDSDPLGSPSNPIVINCEDFECNAHGSPPWAQGTFECLIKLETDDETCGKVQSWVDVDEIRDFKLQADIEPIEEIDLTYSNLSASVSKDTERLESREEIHGISASSLVLEFDKAEDQVNICKADDEVISTKPEDEDQTDAGFSTPKADDINDVSTEPKDEANTGTTISKVDNDFIPTEPENEDQADAGFSSPKSDDNGLISTKSKDRGGLGTCPFLREAGFVSKETQEASLKRKMESHCSPSIRRSKRVAKRVKFDHLESDIGI